MTLRTHPSARAAIHSARLGRDSPICRQHPLIGAPKKTARATAGEIPGPLTLFGCPVALIDDIVRGLK
jgi:hypothetical protein